MTDAVADERTTRSKQILRAGSFVLADGKRFRVTPYKLNRYVQQFDAMQQAGVKVKMSVDHSPFARDEVGVAKKMWLADGWIVAEVELSPSQVELFDKTSDVSVEIGNYKDGTGKVWDDVIYKVSIVQEPVVSGQEGWKTLGRVVSLSLSRMEPNMDELLQAISDMVGGEAVTDAEMARTRLGNYKMACDKLMEAVGDLADEEIADMDGAVAALGKVKAKMGQSGESQTTDQTDKAEFALLKKRIEALENKNNGNGGLPAVVSKQLGLGKPKPMTGAQNSGNHGGNLDAARFWGQPATKK